MRGLRRRVARGIAACVAAAWLFGAAGTPRADVISPTPTLPLLGVPYLTTGAAGCFPSAGLCIEGGSITLTSLISSGFNLSGQHFLTNATFSGDLTTIGGTPFSTITLVGTLAQQVTGRTFSTQLGSFLTLVTAAHLTGPLLGHTLTLDLASAPHSTGVTSISALGGYGGDTVYRISSFFDIFVDLSLDSNPPLSTTRGPLRITATPVPVPEPAGLAALAVGLLGLGAVHRGRGLKKSKDGGRHFPRTPFVFCGFGFSRARIRVTV